MQSDILKKIDVLVEMAGASLNIDTLQAELSEIEKESSRLKKEISVLSGNDTGDKYFKASEKQVDENIKVSLEAKIRKQEKSVKELHEQIDSISIQENELHKEIVSLKEEIVSSNDYINALNERIKTIVDAASLEKYRNILSEENRHLDDLVALLSKKEDEYSAILEKLNYINLAKEEIKSKLESDKVRLQETKANLGNPSSYVDEELKQMDEDRSEEIKKQLLALDKRRIEIITDPAIIGYEAKELIIEDDRTSALSKVKELVTLVKTKPFMDIPSGSELVLMLQEELENSSNKRDEFAALIDSKDYSGVESDVVADRINYLNIQIANYEDKIRLLNEEIKRLDTVEFNELTDKLNKAVEISTDLEQSIQDYEEIMANEDEKTPKRRAVLSAAFQKKLNELEIIKAVIANYKRDQKSLINRAYEIESVLIASYEKMIEEIKEEIVALNKNLLATSKAKDVLAIENDKKKLKELDEMVKAIKHRQKYSETPSEIFDEIEIYLGTIEDDENNEDSEEPFLNYNYDFVNDDIKEIDLTEEVEDINETEEMVTIEPEFELSTEEVMNELPEITDEVTESERFKVIAIEPVNEPEKNESNDNPFIIADYKDDDYIDVDTIFDSDGVL